MTKKQVLKQYYIINSDLNMSAGKIGVQTAHGATIYVGMAKNIEHEEVPTEINLLRYKRYTSWRYDDNEGMRKIILTATELEMTNLTWTLKGEGIWAYPVFDRGLTEVPADSFTCLVVEPLPEDQCKKLFGHFKLLKDRVE